MAREALEAIRRAETAAREKIENARRGGEEKIENAKSSARSELCRLEKTLSNQREHMCSRARFEAENEAEKVHLAAADAAERLRRLAEKNSAAAKKAVTEEIFGLSENV